MARSRSKKSTPELGGGLAFLLSQVGAHSSTRFGESLERLGLKPAHAGILRVIAQTDGLSQQALGERLGVFPSRLVAVLDELEERKLVERRDSPGDRRSYALYLTRGGRSAHEQIEQIGLEHQNVICAALNELERAQLTEFLKRIADEQQLEPGIHPGFRKLGQAECK